ncbi:glutamate receptor ionotropic, kainate 2-like [Parasteatoda tepidariorum]|uniref:glutamate receptor ionotropic, kainate 2-like n=1 Tax=Parasteatoda tepidariorum TaxID=114398 RepID=UPI001C726FEE|nr:glutamate receptor ionotropic, kainate 2-like [Parasteatoda tepidariorum]
MMRTFWWIVAVTCLLFGIGHCLPSRIHVGGIFEDDDDESDLAFRIAIDWLNTDETLLRNSRMIAEVVKLETTDSIKSTQLSCGLLQKGVASLFGPQSEIGSMHVQSICDDLEVPHVEARWDYKVQRDQLSVNLYPHPSVLTNAFVHLVNIFHWEEFTIIYEEDDAIIRLKPFLEEGEKQKWSIRIYQFKNSNYRETFWEVKQYRQSKGRKLEKHEIKDHRIVLDVPRKNLYTVLKAAQQVGMMTEHQKFLITSLDLHTIDLDDFQYSKTNITGLRLVQEESKEFQLLLEEVNERLVRRREQPPLRTLKTESVLMYDSVKRLAYALEQMDSAKNIAVFPPISCNLMNKGIDGTSLFNFMKNGKTTGLSGLIEFDPEGFRSAVSLDVMYVTQQGLKKIGYILPDKGINVTSPESSDFEYTDLENSHFKVATVIVDPYTMYAESSEKKVGNDRYEGFAMDLLEALSAKLRFTYEVHVVQEKNKSNYGSQDAVTKEWSGMIGRVMRGEADLAIADFTITTSRLAVVDFTHPFMQTGIGILFKKPTEKVTSLFSFLSPFSGGVWVLVMAAYTFISISYFLVGRLSPYEWANPHPCRQNDQVEENVFSLLNSMWFAIGSLMQQGSDIAPTAMSTRAVTSIWYFFCLIMISSYTANLASFLTVQKLVSPINNANELANQEKIKYGCLEDGSTHRFFKDANLTTYKKMNEFMKKHHAEVMVKSNDEGIRKVKEGNYAYLMEVTSIEYKTERECNLTQVGSPLDSKSYGIAIKKDRHKLRDWLSKGVLKLTEEGKLHTFKERWWKQKKGGGSCVVSSSGSVTELGLGNVGGVFLVMLMGICLSACMGVVEFLWFQRKLQKTSQESVFKLLMKEIKYAVTCGSSSKAAPKLKKKNSKETEEEVTKTLPGYNSFY